VDHLPLSELVASCARPADEDRPGARNIFGVAIVRIDLRAVSSTRQRVHASPGLAACDRRALARLRARSEWPGVCSTDPRGEDHSDLRLSHSLMRELP